MRNSAAWPLDVATAPMPALQARHPLLERRDRGVGDPAVDRCRTSAARTGSAASVGVLEDEARGLVDRDGAGAGRRVRHAPGVHGAGAEAPAALAHAHHPAAAALSCGKNRAEQDQHERGEHGGGQRLAEEQHPGGDGDGRVDVGEHHRPGRADLPDELEEQHERRRGAEQPEACEGEQHLGRGSARHREQRRAGGRPARRSRGSSPSRSRLGTSPSLRAAMIGPDRVAHGHEQHLTDREPAAPRRRAGPRAGPRPRGPAASPAQRSGPSRSVSPARRPASTAMMGTAATSSPVSELSSRRSASESNAHGPMISTRANTSSARPCARTTVTARGPRGQRQQHQRAERGAREHQHRHRDLGHRDLDQQVRDAPQHAHRREQDPSTSAHGAPRSGTSTA